MSRPSLVWNTLRVDTRLVVRTKECVSQDLHPDHRSLLYSFSFQFPSHHRGSLDENCLSRTSLTKNTNQTRWIVKIPLFRWIVKIPLHIIEHFVHILINENLFRSTNLSKSHKGPNLSMFYWNNETLLVGSKLYPNIIIFNRYFRLDKSLLLFLCYK